VQLCRNFEFIITIAELALQDQWGSESRSFFYILQYQMLARAEGRVQRTSVLQQNRQAVIMSDSRLTVYLSHVCSLGSLSERSKHYTSR